MNLRDFVTTKLSDKQGRLTQEELRSEVIGFVKATKTQWENARNTIERTWTEAWAAYLGTPEAMEELRVAALHSVGDVKSDWRHRINVGKAFESVETIHSYLMQALFPNRDWFSAQPTQPGYADMAKVVKSFTLNKLDSSNFQSYFANYLRQLLITGSSVMALPWRYETIKFKKRVKRMEPSLEYWTASDSALVFSEIEVDKVIHNEPDFEVLDMMDVYLDPNASDPNRSGLLRRIVKSRADILDMVRKKLYHISEVDVMHLKASVQDNHKVNKIKSFQGVSLHEPVSLDDEVELWEYWGDVYLADAVYRDVVALYSGEYLLRFESNPYYSGKPFIVGTYIPLPKIPYAIGAIQPSLGLLHELNIITNQRLDNLELSVDAMWKMVDDGVLNPDDVYTEPGKVLMVGDMNSLEPIQMPNNFMVTYQEAQYLENKINANFGTPPLISTGQSRAGERVTAAEIQAVKDAGGNRLSGVHKHIEATTLRPLLSKVFRLMQQFVNESEIINVVGSEPGTMEYYQVDPDVLMYDFVLKPVGADHVIDQQQYVQKRVDFLGIVANIPQMAALINYEAVLRDILQQSGFDEPDRYIAQQQQPVAPEQVDPNAGLKDEVRQMGGDHLLSAMQADESANGDPMQMISAMMGANQPSEDIEEIPEEDLLLS